jgi:hypothetical protein
VSGQLHTLAALPPGKEPSVPIGYEVGLTPESVWTTWRKFLTPLHQKWLDLRNFIILERQLHLYQETELDTVTICCSYVDEMILAEVD